MGTSDFVQALPMEMAPEFRMRASPALVAYAQLLVLPAPELEQVVERELAENPALERVERPLCSFCARPLHGSRCPRCERPSRRASSLADGESLLRSPAPDQPSLCEELLLEVGPLLAEGDRFVAEFLIGSLDERGFLDGDVDEVARGLGIDATRARRVLSLIQEAGPPGLGAGDLRECLLLQLDRCERRCPARDLARQVVASHLHELGRGRYGAIAHALGVTRDEVVAAHDFIRAELRPHPDLPSRAPSAADIRIRPDAIIRERPRGSGFDVELIEPRCLELVVSPAYERLAGANGAITRDERERVERQLLAARAFLRRLNQRWETVRAVLEAVVDRQQEFLRGGPRFLRPLTRAQIARDIGVHESTVGRAVADRHAILPSGRLAPLSDFFLASRGPSAALAELVAGESRPKPDAELAGDLAELGFTVARRTVAKYRDRLGIPPHFLR